MAEQRPISRSQRDWLRAELGRWRGGGIISAEQMASILGLYESEAAIRDRGRQHAVGSLLALAATMVGFAILLLIGYNWQAMPAVAKLFVIFTVVAGLQRLGLAWLDSRPAIAEAVLLLACLAYGAAIWLVAQIFHLNAHYPDGILWWLLGVLPMALLTDRASLHVLCALLAATWAGMEVLNFAHWRWWGLAPNGAYLTPLLVAPGLAWAYRRGAVAIVSLYVNVLGWWMVLQGVAWGLDPWLGVFAVGSLAAGFLILAECHPTGSAMAAPIRLVGAVGVAACLIPVTYFAFWHEPMAGFARFRVDQAVLLLACLAPNVAAFTLAYLFQMEWSAAPSDRAERWRRLAMRLWTPGLLGVLFIIGAYWRLTMPNQLAILPVLAGNVVMVGLALWLMRIGLREDRSRPFSGGVAYFLLWTILRYVDLFGDAGGMVGAAILFLICATALYGVARFWGSRKGELHVA